MANPQTNYFNPEPRWETNAAWVNGIAPGYWPQEGGGLNLELSAGAVFANGSITGYSGGSLAMTAMTTNYVFLDPTASWAPNSNTSGFTDAMIPLATVVCSSTQITSIVDERLSPQGGLATIRGVEQGSYLYAHDTGIANAYVVSLSPGSTLVDGTPVFFFAAHSNTGASTLALNGGSAKAITKSGTTALTGGEINANQIVLVVYDGTEFQIISGSGGGGGGGTPGGTNHQTQINASGSFGGVGPGSSGTVLTSNGASADPSFQAVPDMVGDSGSGGTHGLVPAPGAGTAAAGDFLKADGTWADPGLNVNVVAVASAVAGLPAAGQLVMIYTSYTVEVFPANFATPNSYGTVGTNPTLTAVYDVYKNGSLIGTISISTSGVFTFATTGGSSFTLNPNDRLTAVAPGTQDATLADVSFTLVGTRTGSIAANQIPLLSWMGTYSGVTTYQPWDVVAYTVSGKVQSYVCKATTTGNVPTNASFWDLMAQAGADGTTSAVDVQEQVFVYAADTGAANAYVVALSPAVTSLVDGSMCVFRAAHANTGASTLNLNSLGASSLVKTGGTALTTGDIKANQVVFAVWDNTNSQWEMIGGGGGDTTAVYVVGTKDAILTNAAVNSWAARSIDCAASSPNAMDDEFDDTSGNSGTVNGLNARWSWLNQNVATITFGSSCAQLLANQHATYSDNCIIQTAPSTPWEVLVKIAIGASNSSNQFGGIVLYDSIGGKLVEWLLGSQYGFQVFYVTNPTTWNSQPYNTATPAWPYNQAWIYLKVKDDGTNLIFSYSFSGAPGSFQVATTFGRTAWMTNGANRVGVFIDGNGGNGSVTVAVDFFRRTA